MKKILFGILFCLVANIAVADSLSDIDMDGSYASYNNAMNSEVHMDATRYALKTFPIYMFKGILSYGEGGSNLFLETYLDTRQADFWYWIEKDSFAKVLREQLRTNGKLTLRLIYDVCTTNSYKVPFETTTEGRQRALRVHKGADEVCEVFIQVVIRRHNELVSQSSKKQEVTPQPVEPQKKDPQKKKLFGLIK